jgi:molybdate transport system substrate-binding protein
MAMNPMTQKPTKTIRFAVASPKPEPYVPAMLRLLLSLMIGATMARADGPVSVAAAANLTHIMEPLMAVFSQTHPRIKVRTSFGSSGSLVAQITHGAPYDVFLSADLEYPRALIIRGQADDKSLSVFAIGQLVLWTKQPELRMDDLADALGNFAVGKLAIANPVTAPYGRAAKQTLEQLGRWDRLLPKLVIGENISQTAQLIDSGNADLGFVALSTVLALAPESRGRWLTVSPALYSPLLQGAVLTTRGMSNPSARTFLEFLQSPEAQNLFARYGYGVRGSL